MPFDALPEVLHRLEVNQVSILHDGGLEDTLDGNVLIFPTWVKGQNIN
jgi:hypothetical protein